MAVCILLLFGIFIFQLGGAGSLQMGGACPNPTVKGTQNSIALIRPDPSLLVVSQSMDSPLEEKRVETESFW